MDSPFLNSVDSISWVDYSFDRDTQTLYLFNSSFDGVEALEFVFFFLQLIFTKIYFFFVNFFFFVFYFKSYRDLSLLIAKATKHMLNLNFDTGKLEQPKSLYQNGITNTFLWLNEHLALVYPSIDVLHSAFECYFEVFFFFFWLHTFISLGF